MRSSAASRYQQVDILTMPAERRVVLLYTHLLLNLRQAAQRLAANDVAGRSGHLLKAQEIVAELSDTLDRKAGGAIADNLAALYAWLLAEVAVIDCRPERGRLDKVITTVEVLHQAWTQAAEQVLQAEPAQAAG